MPPSRLGRIGPPFISIWAKATQSSTGPVNGTPSRSENGPLSPSVGASGVGRTTTTADQRSEHDGERRAEHAHPREQEDHRQERPAGRLYNVQDAEARGLPVPVEVPRRKYSGA